MDKTYIEREKQINARINPKLHSQLKKICESRDVILSTLIERLIELGLPHYLETNTVATEVATKDDLVDVDERLKKLESQINDVFSLALQDSDRISNLQRLFKSFSTTAENVPVTPNLGTDTHIGGTELSQKEMLEYVKANPNSKNPRRDIERGLKDYPNEVWEPQAKGYWKRIK